MAEYISDQMQYVDNGRTIRKDTWYDPATGQNWDTFTDVGEAPAGAETGNVVQQQNPYNVGNMQAAAGNMFGQSGTEPFSATPAPPTGGQPATYAAPSGKTKAPDNVPYASTGGGPQMSVPGGGAPPANPNNPWGPQGGNISPELIGQARNLFLYNEDQPQQAFQNVLRGMGFQTGLNNPFTNILSRSAPGLGAAYNIGMANRGPGTQVSSDPGGDFASFIRQNLTGGGLFNTFNSARAGLGSAIDQIQQQANAGSPAAVNPYIGRLQQILESGGGSGLAGVLSALGAPFMSPGVAGAYGQGLQNALSQGIYNYGQSGAFEDPSTYWLRYLYR